jgi:hypothetical protein
MRHKLTRLARLAHEVLVGPDLGRARHDLVAERPVRSEPSATLRKPDEAFPDGVSLVRAWQEPEATVRFGARLEGEPEADG